MSHAAKSRRIGATMDKISQNKINNNNRKRGGSFEKRVADFLDMDVVPYSGSNARFGYGDVRDSRWLGECKNITPNDGKVTIKREWLDKNNKRASECNRIPYLAWMPAGRSEKYVIIDYITFITYFLGYVDTFRISITQKSVNNHNIIIHIGENWMKELNRMAVHITFDNNVWYMMRIELFKSLLDMTGMKGTRIQN